MSDRRSRLIVAAALAAATALPGVTAEAQEICRTATASAGPADGGPGAADEAHSRLPAALETTEQEIRRVLLANGFRPGAARLAQATDSCFEAAALKSGIRCEARQAVCVTFRSI